MTRFLRYAVEHGRKIRAVFLLDGAIVQKTVEVVSYDESAVSFRIGAKKKPVELPLSAQRKGKGCCCSAARNETEGGYQKGRGQC